MNNFHQSLFSALAVGSWFKETSGSSVWHLKVSQTHARYRADGTLFEPRFSPDDLVWVANGVEQPCF
jgi:hypothetical protein